MRLTEAQRRHLSELAAIRKTSSTGEAYFYPTGSQHKTVARLSRLGLLESADYGRGRSYRLTDAGYAEGLR